MSGVVATRAQVARDHTGFALRDPDALVVTALRTKSVYAREILAELAWPGHTPADVEAWAGPGGGRPSLDPDMDAGWIARYGQVLAVQTGRPEERAAARQMLEAVLASDDADALPDRAVELLLQLRVADRDPAAADLTRHAAVRAPVARAALADLANPALFPGGDEESWLAALNEAVGSPGVAPLALRPTSDSPFDRLAVDVAPVSAPYLVTVLMSSWRPGPPLLTALRSLLAQTWTNLEILVVDDASGEEYAELLTRAEGLDSRIRVIRKGLNGGTYRARNTALRQASGEFVTVLDSDDWLHPQAIEIAVRTMDERPGVLATIGQGVRISEDLELNRLGYQPRVTSAPSMMVRVHPVIDRIGYFDPTRKGADTEYAARIAAAFGPHAVQNLPVVMTFLRGGDTLSSAEFSRGWRHGARYEYKCAYRPWHERISTGREAPFLDPSAPRRFPEPRRWATPIAPGLGRPRHIDLCVAGDWRRWGGPQRSMIEEIRAAREAGLRVAVMHLEAFRFMTVRDDPLCAAVTELIGSGAVEWIHPDDDVDIGVLVIRYPPILQYPPSPGKRSVRARHVLIMANQAPLEPDGTDQRYVVADVTARTRELFGTDPVWVPQSPGIRALLQAQDPGIALTPWDNPGLIDVDEWTVRQHTVPSAGQGPVVVGRYSRDTVMKFPPDLATIRRAYEFGPGYEVRMMGARNTIGRLLAEQDPPQERPANWVLLKHKEVEVIDFLGGLDFFLYLDHPDRFEAFGRTILEAAASGVLTIAHPKHQSTFGDTIDYAAPGAAQGLIADYVAHPERYAERVARSRAMVLKRFGHEQFVDRLLSLGGVVVDDEPAGDAQGARGRGKTRWQVRTEQIRSAADAARTDQLAVVHENGVEDGAQDEVARWWAAQLQVHPGDGLPQALLDTAPSSVGALLTRRDGLVHLAVRDGSEGAREALRDAVRSPVAALTRLSGITVPAGWSDEAWWAESVV